MSSTLSESNLSSMNFASEDSDDTSIIDFWQIVSVLQKWWWLIIVFVTIVTALAALVVFRITPVYKASTILEVKQEERNIVNVSAVENVIVDKEFLTTQVELLKSETLSLDVIESLQLLSDTDFYNPENLEWAELARAEKIRSVSSNFKNKLSVSPVGRSRLIKVSFDHSNPQRAALITNAIAETFIQNSLNQKFNGTAEARKFLSERLETVRSSLEKAERDLVDYAEANKILNINSSGNENENSEGSLEATALVTLNSELTNARSNRIAAEMAYNQSLTNTFSSEVLTNPAISALKLEKRELSSEYTEKLATLKPGFPEMIELKSRIDLFELEIESESQAIIDGLREEIKREYDLALSTERDRLNRVSGLKTTVVGLREKGVEYNILKRQLDTERSQYDAILQRLKEVSVADDLGSNLVQVVDKAQAPLFPFKPNKVRSIILAILLSSGLAFGLAYLFEIIDDKVRTPEDVKNKLKQIILGVIPLAEKTDDILSALSAPGSSISEGYASLRTNIQLSGASGGPQVIQFTSTRSGEGKSVSSLGIALRFAGVEEQTLLIDADMRLPTFIQSENATGGLSGVLTTNVDIPSQILSTHFDNFDLLPSGNPVPNPSELLSGARFDELLEYAKGKYSRIIVDSPPVLGLADALILAAKADATFLIIESGSIRTPIIKATIERLTTSGVKLSGVILSKYKTASFGYSDKYKYIYGNSPYGKENRKGKKVKFKEKRKFNITS